MGAFRRQFEVFAKMHIRANQVSLGVPEDDRESIVSIRMARIGMEHALELLAGPRGISERGIEIGKNEPQPAIARVLAQAILGFGRGGLVLLVLYEHLHEARKDLGVVAAVLDRELEILDGRTVVR